MALHMMADIITSPKTISTLALFTVFTPELPVLLNIGPDSQSIIEIAILVCGAMLLLGLGLQVTARHRMYVTALRYLLALPSPKPTNPTSNTRRKLVPASASDAPARPPHSRPRLAPRRSHPQDGVRAH